MCQEPHLYWKQQSEDFKAGLLCAFPRWLAVDFHFDPVLFPCWKFDDECFQGGAVDSGHPAVSIQPVVSNVREWPVQTRANILTVFAESFPPLCCTTDFEAITSNIEHFIGKKGSIFSFKKKKKKEKIISFNFYFPTRSVLWHWWKQKWNRCSCLFWPEHPDWSLAVFSRKAFEKLLISKPCLCLSKCALQSWTHAA